VYKCKWRERIRNFKNIKKERDPSIPSPLVSAKITKKKKGGLSFGLDNVGNIII